MKRKNLWLALAMTALCGCLDVEDELTLNADGSGSVRIAVKSAAGMSEYMERSTGGDPDTVQYPPTAAKEAKLFFPSPGFEVKSDTTMGDTSEQTLVIDAKFKDVETLLASPYARAHAIELKKDGDALLFRGIPAIGGVAHFFEGMKSNKQAAMYAEATSELSGKKSFKAQFKVNLPNAVTQANGQREGKSVVWLADRDKSTNATAFFELTDRVLEARCAAGGLTFTPKSPARLALKSFAELSAGALGNAVTGPDAKQVEAAAKFVPCALQVQRTIDLSGKGYGGGSQARLVGYVVMPAALKPQRWGATTLEEVLDAKGKSLKPPEEDESMRFSRRYSSMHSESFGEEDDEESGEDKPAKPAPAEERHLVSFEFQSPDWTVKTISKLKGSITLNYGGSLHLAKVTNAIPGSWIPAATASDNPFSMGFSSSSDEDGARLLKNADLDQIGAKITCGSVNRQAGGLMLQLKTESEACVIKEVQVYDADGKACPTMTMSSAMMGEDEGNQVYVGGDPKAPLSLAITVSGSGGSVKLPIQLENIPVRDR